MSEWQSVTEKDLPLAMTPEQQLRARFILMMYGGVYYDVDTEHENMVRSVMTPHEYQTLHPSECRARHPEIY